MEAIGLRRGDLEAAALLRIQQCGKKGGRVEARETHEVNRTVHAHKRGGVEVADDAMIFDGLRVHASKLSQLAKRRNRGMKLAIAIQLQPSREWRIVYPDLEVRSCT